MIPLLHFQIEWPNVEWPKGKVKRKTFCTGCTDQFMFGLDIIIIIISFKYKVKSEFLISIMSDVSCQK